MKRVRMWQSVFFLVGFVLWTVSVCFIDVQAIGPGESVVGLAGLNSFVHGMTGVHMDLYVLTDWLSLIPAVFVMGFGVLGLCQWIHRKRLGEVDRSILALGVFYIAVMAVYVIFEMLVINDRPVLINGVLEASYPSSTTVLTVCVMETAELQLRVRIQNKRMNNLLTWILRLFTAFMVIARFLSGVHWFTDIVGGILVSAGLVYLYRFFAEE